MPKGLLVIEGTRAGEEPARDAPAPNPPAPPGAPAPNPSANRSTPATGNQNSRPGPQPNTGKMTYQVSVTVVPDTKEQFRINYESSWFAADAVKLKTSNGLLNTVAATSDDRTHEAVVNLARSIGAVQGFSLPSPAEASLASASEKCAPNQNFKMVLDLSKTKDLESLPGWLQLDFVDGKASDLPVEALKPDAYKNAVAACEKGICTRAARPLRVRINKECNDDKLWQDTVVYVPDETQFTPVRLDRALFADKCFGVGFTNGMVSEVRIRNASTAENLARMPEDILRALVTVPSELLQLRFNYSVAQRDLSAAELSRLQAEKALQDFAKGATANPGTAVTRTGTTPVTDSGDAIGAAPTLTEAECALTPSP